MPTNIIDYLAGLLPDAARFLHLTIQCQHLPVDWK
jgi:hypothetical protein